jgi:hypothetical protein
MVGQGLVDLAHYLSRFRVVNLLVVTVRPTVDNPCSRIDFPRGGDQLSPMVSSTELRRSPGSYPARIRDIISSAFGPSYRA